MYEGDLKPFKYYKTAIPFYLFIYFMHSNAKNPKIIEVIEQDQIKQ